MTAPFPLPQPLPGTPLGPSPNLGGLPSVSYDIRVRDQNLNLVGEVDAYVKLTMVLRFNAVGSWALTIDAAHPMAPFLKTRGYGIVVTRQIINPAGQVISSSVILSGPMRKLSRANTAGVKTLTVSGYDDMIWLGMRDAWSVPNYPYIPMVEAGEFSGSTGAYYELADTSGTTAVDSSGNGRNGTYNGTFTLNTQPGAVDDPTGAVSLDGSTGYVDCGWSIFGFNFFMIHGWINVTTMPTVTNPRIINNSQADVSNNGIEIFLNSDGSISACAGNGTTHTLINTAVGAITAGKLYHVAFIFDSSKLGVWINGALATTTGAGANFAGPVGTLSLSNWQIGRGVGGANYLNAKMAHWAITANNLTNTVVVGAGRLLSSDGSDIYNVGISRFAKQATDALTSDAETVLQHYINVNAGPGAITERQVPTLSLSTNNHNGSTVSAAARFDNLLGKDGNGLLQEIARASTPELGFKVVQNGTALLCTTYVPADKTSNVLFSEELGNVGDVTYDLEAPDFEREGNMVVVAGSGAGTARTFLLAKDATSITNWGRTEAFIDRRDTADMPTLTTSATTALDEFKGKTSYSFQLLPNGVLTFWIDFNLCH